MTMNENVVYMSDYFTKRIEKVLKKDAEDFSASIKNEGIYTRIAMENKFLDLMAENRRKQDNKNVLIVRKKDGTERRILKTEGNNGKEREKVILPELQERIAIPVREVR